MNDGLRDKLCEKTQLLRELNKMINLSEKEIKEWTKFLKEVKVRIEKLKEKNIE